MAVPLVAIASHTQVKDNQCVEQIYLGPGICVYGCPALSKDPEKKWRKNNFDFRAAVHEPESHRIKRPVDPRTKEPIGPAHEFEVILEPDTYTEEKYILFENYQRHVHKESPSDITKNGFKRFLCSGLGQSSQRTNGVEQKLGSYHQCYRLDGRLLAMGVLDLLPGCVSSVYLVYHQDVKDWYFGKLSALREISLAVEGDYQFYYMDPEIYLWDRLDADFLARLSARNYVSMSLERQLRLPPHKLANIDELELGLDQEALLRLQHYQREGTSGLNESQSSALAAGMPGLMSLDGVQNEINLGGWPLKLGNMLLHLEDLRGWNSWDIRDASSLKGIVAELAAALGPKLVSQLVLELG
ncbi:MAG: hypothetical protein Q9225_001827 [Loekoesia sp. 1 TL-2023]